MDRLGHNLLLTSLTDDGKIPNRDRLKFGLMGAELVRLAAAARIDIQHDRIVIVNATPTGDPRLDDSLANIGASRRPPKAKTWVAAPRHRIVEEYAALLAAQSIVQPVQVGLFKSTRWMPVNPAPAQAARRKLAEIAAAPGPFTTEESAFAGLAYASGIVDLLYPRFNQRQIRRRFAEIAKGQWSARAVHSAVTAATDATVQATTDAAISAATDAATQAAISAATEAATHAAISAATEAAVSAAVAASSDGGGAGHHGGH